MKDDMNNSVRTQGSGTENAFSEVQVITRNHKKYLQL